MDQDTERPEPSPRRSFLAAFISVVVGAVPIVIGSLFFLAPLWRKKSDATGDAEGFVDTGLRLEALPEDGTPMLITVTQDRVNAWNLYPDSPVGSVWIRNVAGTPLAFSSICPHLGCAVEFRSAIHDFFCPCHNSTFDLEGTRLNQIPPRNLDTLPTKLVDGMIWIKYERFRAGIPEKVEV
ncbi:MAG: Rieske 2Fe-2S domain-containing protein [Planctomycetota bacterium]